MLDIKSAFNSFNDKKILIVGDVMIDAYCFGSVDRISPEAPVPILNVKEKDYRLGGASNVAQNIKALGAKPIMCSVVGNDDEANLLCRLLTEKNDISDKYIVKSDRVTTVKTRMISGGQQLLRLDSEDTTPLSEALTKKFISVVKEAIDTEKPDAIIFEDYDKGVITPLFIDEISFYAKQKNIITTVDPKHRNFLDYKNVTLFKPNFKEFVEGAGADIQKNDIEGIILHAKEYHKQKNIDNMLVTLSEYGMLLVSEDDEIHIPAEKRDISDVSGAGDTVISTITLCLAAGLPKNVATHIANISGGLVCEKIGVVPIDKRQLLDECERLL